MLSRAFSGPRHLLLPLFHADRPARHPRAGGDGGAGYGPLSCREGEIFRKLPYAGGDFGVILAFCGPGLDLPVSAAVPGGVGGSAMKAHGPGNIGYIAVWAALIVLTAVTVAVSYVHLGMMNVVVALLLASAKASPGALFFTHLRRPGTP